MDSVDAESTSMSQDITLFMTSFQRIRDKLERISPDGLVTFSVRGVIRTIERKDITRWLDRKKYNWFALCLAEHEKQAQKVADPIFIGRNPLVFDYVLDLLAERDVDFSILCPEKQSLLMQDIEFYQLKDVAELHLKHRNSSHVWVPRPVASNRRLKLLESAGKVCYLTCGHPNTAAKAWITA